MEELGTGAAEARTHDLQRQFLAYGPRAGLVNTDAAEPYLDDDRTPNLAADELEILARDVPVSHMLLVHDHLMTPVLGRTFGAVHALQTHLEDHGDRLVRWSTLYQTATGAPLLQARLVIFKSALPGGFADRLLSGTRLFGSLLIEAGLAVRMADHYVFRVGQPGGSPAGAWGRRHRLLCVRDDAPLCDAEERLEDETTLQGLILPSARDHMVQP